MKTTLAIAAVSVVALSAAANAQTFSGAGYLIPDNNPAGASSSAAVAGVSGPITDVTVDLTLFRHTWVGDITATLTAPGGETFALFTRPGRANTGAGEDAGVASNFSFNDAATLAFWSGPTGWGSIPDAGTIPGGAYRTTDVNTGAVTSLLAFVQGVSNLNGNWSLRMTDSAGLDTGGIEGWSITFVPAPGAAALVGLGGLAALRRRR